MPTMRPCSSTTSEPRFSFAMVVTASTARPAGSMLSSRVPLARRISLTCMARPPRWQSEGSLVQTPPLRNGLEVFPDHGLDGELAVCRARQVIAQLGGGDLRDVVVLRDGQDLLLGQPGQGDTIFEG